MPIDSDDSVPLVVSALNKGIGPIASPLEPEETLGVGWSLLDEEIALPAAVLYEERLAHNVKWMRDFMKEYGVQLAPHGKTTMAPKLFGRHFSLTTKNPFGLKPFYALHAWVWKTNPAGWLQPWNPQVSCP